MINNYSRRQLTRRHFSEIIQRRETVLDSSGFPAASPSCLFCGVIDQQSLLFLSFAWAQAWTRVRPGGSNLLTSALMFQPICRVEAPPNAQAPPNAEAPPKAMGHAHM